MGNTISKSIFEEIVGRAVCDNPVIHYDTSDERVVGHIFWRVRDAFEFMYNTLEILGRETFHCKYHYLDGSGNEQINKMEIRFDFIEIGGSKGCACLVDGVEISSYVFKGRDEFADEFVYRVFAAMAKEIHSKKEEMK